MNEIYRELHIPKEREYCPYCGRRMLGKRQWTNCLYVMYMDGDFEKEYEVSDLSNILCKPTSSIRSCIQFFKPYVILKKVPVNKNSVRPIARKYKIKLDEKQKDKIRALLINRGYKIW